MSAIARMAVLDLRTVAPYRNQGLLVFGLGVLVFASKPTVFVLALVLFFTSQFAAYPFMVADKAGLETLYAVLPLPRRSVLYGHYAWAVALFLATASVGTALALLLAWAQNVPFGGRTLVMVLTASWAVFAVNVAIQFPLVIRFGYTRVSVLGTALPLAVVVGTVYKLHLTVPSIQIWLPILWVAGVAAIVASGGVAIAADRRRMRYSGPRSLNA
jgi:ABC-2 family transporter protein